MSYAQERAAKRAQVAKRLTKFVYEPVLFDRMRQPVSDLKPGDVVVKMPAPSVGQAPKSSGQVYVADTEGKFLQMVCINSLTPLKKVVR